MRADHLRPWMDLLLARLEPGEWILAQGRAFEPHRDSFELSQLISGPGCAVVVTQRRVLWVSRSDQRWVRILPFAVVRSYVEFTQAHRYALALDHEGLDRLQWIPAHRFLGWSWGNAEEVYKTAANRPRRTGPCCPCSSGRMRRPASVLL